MSWVAVAVAGSAALGYAGSQNATDAQKAGAEQGMRANQQAYDQQMRLNRPYQTIGTGAVNKLGQLLGLSGYESGAPVDVENYIRQAAGTGYDQGYRSGDLSRDKIIEGALANYKSGSYGDDQSALKTFGYQAPTTAPSSEFGSLMKDFGTQDFEQDPGYAFRLSEGLKAVDRQAAAKGGLMSGAALKASQRYGQDIASQEYQNAFNRYQTNRQNKLQPLQYLTGVGQNAANLSSANAGQYGQNMAQGYGDMANASASGEIAGANAIAGGVGQYLNYQQGQNYLNALKRPSTYTG